MATLPAMPLAQWRATYETLYRFLQLVGKIRLAASVRRNHWWNVPYHLTGRGLTTRPMGLVHGNPVFTIDFDFLAHEVQVTVVDGRSVRLPLVNQSVASLHSSVHGALADLGISVVVANDMPFDLPDSDRPFADDTEHASYDPLWAMRYWQVLSWVNLVLEQFSARFSGKVSPVHHFWHTLDIAATRFVDRPVDQPEGVDPVTREAYSREVISSGFWFGDDDTPDPAFYCYANPEPAGLADKPLVPATAAWMPRNGSHLAVLSYEDIRRAGEPDERVLEFYESAYQAAASLADWDTQAYACAGGVTDPQLSRD